MGIFTKTRSSEFTVPAMSCGHCEAKIQERVSTLDGITKVKADSATKTLKLWYRGAAPTSDTVNDALSDTDYRAEAN